MLWAETMRIRRTSKERFPRFTYVEDSLVVDKTCFFATGQHLKYLVGVMNSTVGWYLCRQHVSILDNGGYMMQKALVEKIPVLQASSAQQAPIISLVDRILAAKKRNPAADTSALEREIDEKVYRLYGLTDDEIRVIESKDKEGEGGSVNERDACCPSGGGVNGRDARCPSGVTKKRKPKIVEEF